MPGIERTRISTETAYGTKDDQRNASCQNLSSNRQDDRLFNTVSNTQQIQILTFH